jgi:Protein of unknown function (DUF2752)
MSVRAPALAPLEWVAIGGAFAIGIASCLDPVTMADGPIVCPFRLLTGLPCPACGLTRSWVFTMHGQWMDAVNANVFGPALLALTLLAVLAALCSRARDQGPPRLEAVFRRPAAIAFFALWGTYGALRMVAGTQ